MRKICSLPTVRQSIRDVKPPFKKRGEQPGALQFCGNRVAVTLEEFREGDVRFVVADGHVFDPGHVHGYSRTDLIHQINMKE